MKRKIFSVLCASLVLGSAGPARAEPLSRQRAIAIALRENPQVAAARARRAQAEAERAQADAARWPTLTLEVGVGPSLKAELVPGTAVESTESRYDVGVDDLSVVLGGRLSILQPLYTFGKIDAYRDAAAHGIRARDAQTEMTRAEIALEVGRLYEGLLLARDATRFFDEIEHYLERTTLATEAQVAAEHAEVTEQDVLRLQSATAAVRLLSHRSRAGEEQARAGLTAYLALPSRVGIEPVEPALSTIPNAAASAARLVADALRLRPELAALEHGALAYDLLGSAEQRGDLPDVFLLGFANGAYTPGRDLAESRYVNDPLYGLDPGILLGLRWQVQPGAATARADARRAQARELRSMKSWALSGVPAQVTRAYEELTRAKRDIDEARRGAARAKQWMVRAAADYTAALVDSQSLVDSTRAYVELRLAELDAIYRYNLALAELAYATGTIVSDNLGLYPGKDPQ